MDGRERILASINHQLPDRLPLDLGGTQSGIHILAYRHLIEELGINESEPEFYDFTQQLVQPSEKILSRFHIDTRYVHPPAQRKLTNFQPEICGKNMGIFDQFGVFWGNDATNSPQETLYYSPVEHPFADFEAVEEIEKYEWPDGKKISGLEGIRNFTKNLTKSGCAIVTPPLGNTFEYTTFLFGLKKAMKLVRRNPRMIIRSMELLLSYWTDYMTTFLTPIKDLVDIVCVNGDLADQTGPLINPKFYREFVLPLDQEFVHRILQINPEFKINYHCCGSVVNFYPSFIEAGYHAINPVQISARDMQPSQIKPEFGDHLTFWGGLCDSQKTLPFGTPEEVAKETKQNVSTFIQGGGYVGANIHNITAEVPAKNIIAMFDAAYQVNI